MTTAKEIADASEQLLKEARALRQRVQEGMRLAPQRGRSLAETIHKAAKVLASKGEMKLARELREILRNPPTPADGGKD